MESFKIKQHGASVNLQVTRHFGAGGAAKAVWQFAFTLVTYRRRVGIFRDTAVCFVRAVNTVTSTENRKENSQITP